MHDYSSGRGQNFSLSSISLHATYDSAEIHSNGGIGNNVSRRYYVEGRQLIGGKLDFILADSPMKFLPASRSLLACPPSGHAGPTSFVGLRPPWSEFEGRALCVAGAG